MLTPPARRALRQATAMVAVAAASAAVIAAVTHGSPATPAVAPAGRSSVSATAPVALVPTVDATPAPPPLTAEQSRHRWQVYDDSTEKITALLTPLGTSGGLWFDDDLGLDAPVLHLPCSAFRTRS